MSQEGQSNNRQFSGFERPSPEILGAFAFNKNLSKPIESFLPVLSEKEANLKVVAYFFLTVILSDNLDQQFAVDYPRLSKELNVGSYRMQRAVREAVKAGYLRRSFKGHKNTPSLYVINWKDAPKAANK